MLLNLRDWDPHSGEGHVMASFRWFAPYMEGPGAELFGKYRIALATNPSAKSMEGGAVVGKQGRDGD